ncbi:serine protease HtrC [Bacillaceae bacterium]
MGYFDDETYRPRRTSGGGPGTRKLAFTAFVSALAGALVALCLSPVLWRAGFFPVDLLPGTSREAAEERGAVNAPPGTVVEVSEESAVVEAVAKAEQAVVGVINLQKVADFWTQNTQTVERGTGSGVIFEKTGDKARLVTNYHVIEGAADVEVSLAAGERVRASVLGADPLTDLAVLEIAVAGKDVPVAEFGDSDKVKTGEPAIAIGNPLGLRFSRTVTKGIISSTERTVPVDVNEDGQPEWELDVIQTDAAINPGNSGGALINIAGQVIGINSLKISQTGQTGVEGIGFAIPINDVKPIINDLIEHGEVLRPYLGIYNPKDLQEIPSYHWTETLRLPKGVHAGVVVLEVAEFGPAAKAGIRPYDVIVKLDDEEIANSAQLRKYLYKNKDDNDQVKVAFYRSGKLMSTIVTLGRQPDPSSVR